MILNRKDSAIVTILVLSTLVVWHSIAEAEQSMSVEEARQLFTEAVALVDDHQFEDALVIFRRIQRSRPHPIVLYNLAWCLSRLNRSQEAIAAFDSYLELSRDDAPERITEARMELARLREEERVTNPAVEILPISQESESEHRSRRRVHRGWFWSLLGATVATGISMAVTGGLTLSINERWLEQGNLSDRDTARGLQDATDGLLIVLSIEALSALVINFFTDFHRSSEEQIDEN